MNNQMKSQQKYRNKQILNKQRKMMRTSECELHEGMTTRLFCKEEGCFMPICQCCFEEEHQGHNVVDISQLLVEIKELKNKLESESKARASQYKGMYQELEGLIKRVGEKCDRLSCEEKKVKSQIEKQIQRMISTIDVQRQELGKKINKISGKIENQRREQLVISSTIPEEIEKSVAIGTGEEIKSIFTQAKSADPKEEEIHIQLLEEISDVTKEVEAFEMIQMLEFFQNMFSPVKAPPLDKLSALTKTIASSPYSLSKRGSLTVPVPENISPQRSQANLLLPSNEPGIARQRELLERLTEKIIEKQSKLNKLDYEIDLKNKQLVKIEKTRENLQKSNNELRLQFEKQNKIFAENLAAFIPEKKKKSVRENSYLQKSSNTSKSKKMSPSSPHPEVGRIQAAERALEHQFRCMGLEIVGCYKN